MNPTNTTRILARSLAAAKLSVLTGIGTLQEPAQSAVCALGRVVRRVHGLYRPLSELA